jgi:hypothetical protein
VVSGLTASISVMRIANGPFKSGGTNKCEQQCVRGYCHHRDIDFGVFSVSPARWRWWLFAGAVVGSFVSNLSGQTERLGGGGFGGGGLVAEEALAAVARIWRRFWRVVVTLVVEVREAVGDADFHG